MDRAKTIAYALEKSSVCPHCGTSDWQWDPDQGGDAAAYEAVAVRCEGCARRDTAQEVAGKQGPGQRIQLIPRAVADRIANTRKRRPRSKRERAGRSPK